MTKLQILIPQYNEDDNIIKPLLDSIAIQQNINLKEDIEVIIGNDGSNIKLSTDFLKTYPFRIQYHQFEHGRLAATRQKLLELATAEYVIFCDADDRFINTIALSFVMQQMNEKTDAIVADFMEENTIVTGKLVYILHSKDSIFVHGKFYRRQFLLDNSIKWHPELHEHQDSPFNVLALTCSKGTKYVQMPLYMWCSNPNSICRKNGIYHSPNTWPHMIDSYDALVCDFKDRGMGQHSVYYAKYCLYATYFEMSHDIWKQEDVAERCGLTYIRIAQFCKKHALLIDACTEEMTKNIIETTQKLAKCKGIIGEMPPFEEWLSHILKLYN